MYEYENVLVERRDEVGIITLNRPEKLNAVNAAVGEDMRNSVAELNADPDIGAIVWTGAGRAFCAGGDTASLGEYAGTAATQRAPQPPMPTIYWLEQLRASKPVVCAINGVCIGAGFAWSLACDVRIASTLASFSTGFVRVGLAAETACTQILPHVVGLQAAADLLLSARRIDAAEALRLGLVLEVVEPDELLPEAVRLASEYAANPPQAVLEAKRLLYANFLEKETTLVARREGEAQRRMAGTPEMLEAITALREKRQPDFRRLRTRVKRARAAGPA